MAAERGFVGDVWARIEEASNDEHYDLADISPMGVLGDPTKASAEAGRAIHGAEIPAYAEIVGEALRYGRPRK